MRSEELEFSQILEALSTCTADVCWPRIDASTGTHGLTPALIAAGAMRPSASLHSPTQHPARAGVSTHMATTSLWETGQHYHSDTVVCGAPVVSAGLTPVISVAPATRVSLQISPLTRVPTLRRALRLHRMQAFTRRLCGWAIAKRLTQWAI